MNTRKGRGKPKVKDDTPIKDVLTPNNNSTKKALFTSCRRMGLGRKKVVHNSQSIPELKIENETTPILTPTIEHSEGPSTSQVTASSSTPIEEKPKGSASRRKKSSNPLKRTIDDTVKSEGKPFQVYVTPIPKKRKIINKDVCTSDSNSLISPKLNEIPVHDNISNDIKNKFINSENIILPNSDTGQINDNSTVKTTKKFALKVSLPLTISKKILDTLPKLIKSEKNNLSVLTSDEKLTVNDKKSVEVTTDLNIKTCESTKSPINESSSNISVLETKPIKKRKVREKNNKIPESVTEEVNIPVNDKDKIVVHTEVVNSAPAMVILNNVHKEEPVIIKEQEKTSKQTKKIPRAPKTKTKSKSATPNNEKKTLDLNNTSSFPENDDDFDKDFRDSTPRNKKKIVIKNKKIVEPKTVVKKPKVKKVNVDTSNIQINEKNKKNIRRKGKNKNVGKNIELISEGKTFDVTVPLSVVESKQLKSKNDSIITLDKTNAEINVSSDLNSKLSNDVSDLKPNEKESNDVSDLKPNEKESNDVSDLKTKEKESNDVSDLKPNEKESNDVSDLETKEKESNDVSDLKPNEKESNDVSDLKTKEKESNDVSDLKPNDKESNDVSDLKTKEKESNDVSDLIPNEKESNDVSDLIPNEKESNDVSDLKLNEKESNDVSDLKPNEKESNDISDLKLSEKESNDISDLKLSEKESNDISDLKLSEKESNDVSDLIPNEKESNDVSDLIPNEKEVNDVSDVIPNEKESNDVSDLIPNEKESNDVSDLIPNEKESNDVSDLIPNEKESSNVSDLIPTEKESTKQTNLGEAKEKTKKDVILNNNEVKLTPPTIVHEETTENINVRKIDVPVIKNKAEKKSYDTDIPLPIKNCTPKNRDEKSPTKILSPYYLHKNDIKSKMDDELSYNDDSCESSHYSTPVYSPIEETAKLPEDKELIIQHCNEISPTQQNNIIYECRVKNSQSPEKNVENKSVRVNESVSSFVRPSTREDVNVELNLLEIKEKVVCETLLSINNEKNQLIDDLPVLIPEKQPEIDDSSNALPVLENNLEITRNDEISSIEREPPILKRQIILPYSPKMLRNSKRNIKQNTIHNRVSSTLKLNKTLLKEDVHTDRKDLKRSNVSKIVLADKKLSLIEGIEKVSISGKVAQEKVVVKTRKPAKKTELLNYYPRVLINLDDIPNYYKDREMGKKKPDEKIHRVNKTPVIRRRTYPGKKNTTPNSRKRKRKNSVSGKKISNDLSFDAHIHEKNIIISRAENYGRNDTKEVKSKRIKIDKEIEKHTESVFFTPPSSRSENDSDSNRNDFQVEVELNAVNNPFGEGTSRQGVSDKSEIGTTSKLTNLITIPTSQKEIVTQEDHEVASISSRSTIRKREKLKQKRKTLLPLIPNASDTSNIDYDSEDDFKTPKSQPKHIPSKNFLIKNDSGVKCIIKNKSCNRLENFRLTDNNSMTAIHRGLCIEYAKSNNNYNKNTKPVETYTNKSLIQNRCSYSDHEPISSMFDSVVDDPESYIRSQETSTSRTITHPLKREVLVQIKEIEQRIKKKSTTLERLNLINIYKKKHNFENLSKATIQMTKGAQEALLELAAVLRQRSETPFDMGTLLDNMAIPHHVVGYNIELDEFT